MANDTKMAFIGHLPVVEVLNALNSLGVTVLSSDVVLKEPTAQPKTTTVNGTSYPILYRKGENIRENGFIHLEFGDNIRSLFYHYDSRFILDPEEIERNLDRGLPEFNQPITTLSLGMDPDAVTLLTQLARYFDGYIDEDDCDAHYYHKVL
jgi:hypothetical protein